MRVTASFNLHVFEYFIVGSVAIDNINFLTFVES